MTSMEEKQNHLSKNTLTKIDSKKNGVVIKRGNIFTSVGQFFSECDFKGCKRKMWVPLAYHRADAISICDICFKTLEERKIPMHMELLALSGPMYKCRLPSEFKRIINPVVTLNTSYFSSALLKWRENQLKRILSLTHADLFDTSFGLLCRIETICKEEYSTYILK